MHQCRLKRCLHCEDLAYFFLTRQRITHSASWIDLSASSSTSLLEPLTKMLTVLPGFATPVTQKITVLSTRHNHLGARCSVILSNYYQNHPWGLMVEVEGRKGTTMLWSSSTRVKLNYYLLQVLLTEQEVSHTDRPSSVNKSFII